MDEQKIYLCKKCGKVLNVKTAVKGVIRCKYCDFDNVVAIEPEITKSSGDEKYAAVSDKAQLSIATDMLKRGDFQNAIEYCKNLVAKTHSSEAYWIIFLAQNGCKNSSELIGSSREIKDFSIFKSAWRLIDDESRKSEIKNILFERVKKYHYLVEYKVYLELSPEISTLSDIMIDWAIEIKNDDALDFIIKAVGEIDKAAATKYRYKVINTYLAKRRFDYVISACEEIVAKNPADDDAYWTLFLAQNGYTNNTELVERGVEIEDFSNLEKAVANEKSLMRKKIFTVALHARIKKHRYLTEYQEYVKLCPKDVEGIVQLGEYILIETTSLISDFRDALKSVVECVKSVDAKQVIPLQENLVKEFNDSRSFYKIEILCNKILEEYQDGKVYLDLFLAQNHCKSLEEWEKISKDTKDFSSFEKAYVIADAKQKKDMENSLYARVKEYCYLNEYQEYLKLMPGKKDEISKLTDVSLYRAIKDKDTALFDEAIKHVEDRAEFASYNLQMAKALEPRKATPYYQKVLEIIPFYDEALWNVFISKHSYSDGEVFMYCADKSNHDAINKELLLDSSNNEYSVNKLFEISFANIKTKTEQSLAIIDFILPYASICNESRQVDNVNDIIDELFKTNQPSQASRYNELLISLDSRNHEAYFNRCLISRGICAPLDLIEHLDKLMADENFTMAMNTYADTYSGEKNIYLDFFYSLENIKKIIYPNKSIFAFVKGLSLSVEDIASRTYEQMCFEEAQAIMSKALEKYGCNEIDDVYKLKKNVSKDSAWQQAVGYAKAGKEFTYATKIQQIIDTQAKRSKENTKEDKKKRVIVTALSVTIAVAFVTMLTLILGMAGVPKISSFWLLIFQGNTTALFTVGIMFILIPLASALVLLLAYLIKSEYKRSKIITICATSIVLVLALACNFVGIGIYGAAMSDSSTTYLGDDYILRLEQYQDTYFIRGYSGLAKDIVLPSTFKGKPITGIEDEVFSSCNNLKSVRFQEDSQLKSISTAFADCKSLTSIELPESLTSIGSHAFSGCSMLESVKMPSRVTRIGNSAFQSCSNLESIEIPSRVTWIGEYAFNGCRSLTSIDIPSGVTHIGRYAFTNCYNLKTIYCGAASLPYDWSSDWNDNNATTIVWNCEEHGVTESGLHWALSNNEMRITSYSGGSTRVTIPSTINEYTVTGIDTFAFRDCRSLSSIELPSSLTNIGGYAFYNCVSLKNIKLPSDLTSIGGYAFYGCKSLLGLGLPSGLTSIGDYAFYNCINLVNVVIPSSVTDMGSNVFLYCDNLETIYCESAGKPSSWSNMWDRKTSYSSSGYYSTIWDCGEHGVTESGLHWISENNSTSIIRYSGASTQVTIPSTINGYPVTSIYNNAFKYCSNVTSIELPDSLTSIGSRAFYICTELTSVVIPNSVISIGECAFSFCDSLTSIVIPRSVMSIDNYAFSYCDNLKTIYCEAEGRPYGWNNTWNNVISSSSAAKYKVEWGYKAS